MVYIARHTLRQWPRLKSENRNRPITQWLATVLGRHFLFPVPLGIYLICLHSLKSFVEFEFCAKKAISGSYGLENSQIFLKKAKNF